MASHMFSLVLIFQMLLIPCVFNSAYAHLKYGYYARTYPSLEHIVRATTTKYVYATPTLGAPILRMKFHDCFVNGCDASLLLNSTKNNVAERNSPPNGLLKGFHAVIDVVKAAVERACPRRVSCADILSLLARDAVSLIHGPFWKLELGRRDGKVSSSARL